MEYIWDLLVNLHWGAVGQIIMIDILLGGDNAVVIAMACRNLPHEPVSYTHLTLPTNSRV